MFKRILVITTLVIFVVVAIAALIGYQYAFKSNVEMSTKKKYLYIPTYSDINQVVDTLQKYNCIKNKQSFLLISKIKKYNTNVKPGKYEITNGMSNWQLINLLRSGKQVPQNVVVPSTRTIDKMAEQVEKYFEFDANALLSAIYENNKIKEWGFNKATIPALFIPNTYQMYWTTTPEQFVERMKKEYDKFWTKERIQKTKNIGLTLVEVSILASIVQSEQMQYPQERPTIAGLYLNRLRIGMPLQSDPTLIFAIGDFTIKRVYDYHKNINSPYNTYKYLGLPPGPILIPDVSSLDAVLNYKKSNYLYMCAREDLSGFHYFSDNLTQHMIYAKLYQNTLNRLKIN